MKRAYKRWSKDEVIRIIKDLHSRGVPLNSGSVARRMPALAYAGRKYLGSWEAAVTAAGFDYGNIRRKSFWSRTRVVERIRELQAAGKPLHVSAAEREYGGLVGAASVYFGSWRQAIKAAGFDYAKIKRQKEWSKPYIITEMRRMNAQGLPMKTTIAVRREYRILHAAAIRYFGSWAAALKAARIEKVVKK
jgi:hypothetical protein